METGKFKYYLKSGLLYRRLNGPESGQSQLIVPTTFRQKVFQIGQASSLSTHQVHSATINRIKFYYYWPGLKSDIKRLVSSCPECQKMSPKCHGPPVPMGKTPLIEAPFKRVSVDIHGPLPRTKKRNAYILGVVCQASKWPEAIAILSINTKHVAEALFNIFTRIGFPEEILKDSGSQFTGKLMSEVYQAFNAKQLRTNVYHPQAIGLIERFNHTLISMLNRL